MKNSSFNTALAVIVSACTLFSCTKSNIKETDPLEGLVKINEGFVPGAAAKLELYANASTITSGFTPLVIALYDSVTGRRIEDAHIKLTPMMDMGMMKHTTPFEDPESEEAVNHVFFCNVTFIMSSMGGSWSLSIKVHNHAVDKEGTITFPITVAEPKLPRVKSFISAADGTKFFVAYRQPDQPKVGINDMELMVYRKESMMSFPADSSLSIHLTPEMPSMGHGSPNNVDPIHLGKGRYRGKVNFTMTGAWRLNLDFMKTGAIADTTQYFDIEF